jgi:plastocyanin
MNSRLLSLVVVSLAGLLHGCGDSDPTPSTTAIADCPAQIDVKDNEFVPKNCKVKAGATVTWKWSGAMEHDVVSGPKGGSPARCTKDTKFPASPLQVSGTFSHTFTTAGDYPYFCTPHCAIDMVGSIKVE